MTGSEPVGQPVVGQSVVGHGPRHPVEETPPRRPNSVRRTTTHDSHRPDGPFGEVRFEAKGRDLWTDGDGRGVVLGESRLDAEIDYMHQQTIRSLQSVPPVPAFAALSGQSALSGFRRAMDGLLPADEDRTSSLLYQLLDDLPVASLVSGTSVVAASTAPPPPGAVSLRDRTNICAGFANRGELLETGSRLKRAPVSVGPVAPDLSRDDDPLAWHPVVDVGPHGNRRRRRIDVWDEDGVWAVEAFFRDTRIDAEGVERIVHEYTVVTQLDVGTLTFLACEAHIGVLPWMQCPGALGSAERLVGTGPGDLRERVRKSFTGPTTCTHLNDTLRALAALPYLTALVQGRTAPP